MAVPTKYIKQRCSSSTGDKKKEQAAIPTPRWCGVYNFITSECSKEQKRV